ncbi:MAG: D-alanyl-D-alanine carboxypeptidase/D-alanyl-D-alanine-endopeptidase [Actinomycetales bacterium mxb001]|nr:MAG: D-alanyl-D-alanine carboxypeptidase/D-alanyl-D-alanine-endopeptidase [Actinomycetales bacterium mxb001]
MTLRRLGGALAGIALLATATVAAPGQASTAVDAQIARDLRGPAASSTLGPDTTIHVADADSGASIFSRAADARQIPASTMKVVTAATALHTLGADHRFITRVVRGDTRNAIIIVGGGDPLLTTSDLDRLALRTSRALERQGVAGPVRLYVDDYLFPAPTPAQGWAPGDSPTYAAAVRPLGIVGQYSSDTVSSAVSAFAAALRARGVTVSYAGRAIAPDNAPEIASFDSHRLSKAVDLMLLVSENNVAEILFRHVALARGYPATWSSSSSAAGEALRELGIETTRLRLVDGSGLSGSNRLTARTLTDLLDLVVDGEHPELASIMTGMPVAGRTGTLTYRFASPPASCAKDEVFAKTGSLTGVSTLAGLTRGADGEWKSFAVMVNSAPSYGNLRLAIDTIAATVHGCA